MPFSNYVWSLHNIKRTVSNFRTILVAKSPEFLISLKNDHFILNFVDILLFKIVCSRLPALSVNFITVRSCNWWHFICKRLETASCTEINNRIRELSSPIGRIKSHNYLVPLHWTPQQTTPPPLTSFKRPLSIAQNPKTTPIIQK